MKLVSAIVITHNRKQLVMRAVESVLKQTYSNLECIVVDDASTDSTNELFVDNDEVQYIYIPQSESRGGNHARNVGIAAAKGEFVAFLDDDDYWLPTKIEKQVYLLEEKKCDVVYCGMRPEIIDEHGNVRYEDWPIQEEGQGDISKTILTHIFILTSGLMVRKKQLEKIGSFDEKLRYWQEYELSIRLAQETKIFAVNECLYVYRIDKKDSQRLTNKYEAWKQNVRYIHFKHRKLYRKLPLLNKIEALRLFYAEAYMRSQNIGKKRAYLYNKTILFIIKRLQKIAIIFSKHLCPNS